MASQENGGNHCVNIPTIFPFSVYNMSFRHTLSLASSTVLCKNGVINNYNIGLRSVPISNKRCGWLHRLTDSFSTRLTH